MIATYDQTDDEKGEEKYQPQKEKGDKYDNDPQCNAKPVTIRPRLHYGGKIFMDHGIKRWLLNCVLLITDSRCNVEAGQQNQSPFH